MDKMLFIFDHSNRKSGDGQLWLRRERKPSRSLSGAGRFGMGASSGKAGNFSLNIQPALARIIGFSATFFCTMPKAETANPHLLIKVER